MLFRSDAAIDVIMMLADMLTDPEILLRLIAASFEIMKAIAVGLISNFGEIMKIVPKLFTAFRDKFKNTDWKAIGIDIIKGIASGFTNIGSFVTDKIKEAGSSIANGFKKFFKINSPSQLFADDVGQYIPQGIAVGVENEMPDTANRINKSIKDNTDIDDIVNGFNVSSKINGSSQPINLTVPVYIGNDE